MKYSYKTKIGYITIEEQNGEIVEINFGKSMDLNQSENELLQDTYREIVEYLDKKRKVFTIPFKIAGTEFQRSVYKELLKIPYGETRSYKDIAKSIGNEKAYRAIGNANNKNKVPIIIPCHRVIGTNNSLVGYAGGIEIKKFLLELEK